jgi:hypothetical protein
MGGATASYCQDDLDASLDKEAKELVCVNDSLTFGVELMSAVFQSLTILENVPDRRIPSRSRP